MTKWLRVLSVLALVVGLVAPADAYNGWGSDGTRGTIFLQLENIKTITITKDGLSHVGNSALPYTGTVSQQAISGDLYLSAAAGTSTALQMRYLAGGMGNVFGTDLTATKNDVAGVIGKYTVTGTNASTYPKAGVIGEVGTKTSAVHASADGAVVAVLGGDEGPVRARAAYTVDFQNTGVHGLGASYFEFGLDLQGPGAHDSYMGARYEKGDIRLGGKSIGADGGDDVVVWRFAGTPTTQCNATCGKGSLAIDTTNGKLYQNTGTKATNTWTER